MNEERLKEINTMIGDRRMDILRELYEREERFYIYVDRVPSEYRLLKNWIREHEGEDWFLQRAREYWPFRNTKHFRRLGVFPNRKYFLDRMTELQNNPSCEMWQYVHGEGKYAHGEKVEIPGPQFMDLYRSLYTANINKEETNNE